MLAQHAQRGMVRDAVRGTPANVVIGAGVIEEAREKVLLFRLRLR
jgi:hypothetical protein